MNTRDDKYIISQIRKGDVSAFSVLIDRHRPMVFTLAFQLLKNREDAEEVAQDAFFKAYRNLNAFEERSSFATWIYRIAYNQAISKLRSRKEEMMRIDEGSKAGEKFAFNSETLDGLEAGDRQRYLTAALNGIKSDEAAMLTLFYFKELSIEEIAEVTGLSKSNVKVKLHRGRKSLLEELQNLLKEEANTLL